MNFEHYYDQARGMSVCKVEVPDISQYDKKRVNAIDNLIAERIVECVTADFLNKHLDEYIKTIKEDNNISKRIVDGIIQTLLGKMFPEESNTKEDKWRI